MWYNKHLGVKYKWNSRSLFFMSGKYMSRTNTKKPKLYVHIKRLYVYCIFLLPFIFSKYESSKNIHDIVIIGSGNQIINIDLINHVVEYKLDVVGSVFDQIIKLYNLFSDSGFAPKLVSANKNDRKLVVKFHDGNLLGYSETSVIKFTKELEQYIAVYSQQSFVTKTYDVYVTELLAEINQFLSTKRYDLIHKKYSSQMSIPIFLTHGDIGLNNVICSQDGLKLLDWEFVAERSGCYDIIFLQYLLYGQMGSYYQDSFSGVYKTFNRFFDLDMKPHFDELLFLVMLERLRQDIGLYNKNKCSEEELRWRIKSHEKILF